MNVVVFIRFDSRKKVKSVKSYGSIVSLLANESVTVKGEDLVKRRAYYLMENSDVIEADNCRIEKTTINRTK